jgi:hypothetical protein
VEQGTEDIEERVQRVRVNKKAEVRDFLDACSSFNLKVSRNIFLNAAVS